MKKIPLFTLAIVLAIGVFFLGGYWLLQSSSPSESVDISSSSKPLSSTLPHSSTQETAFHDESNTSKFSDPTSSSQEQSSRNAPKLAVGESSPVIQSNQEEIQNQPATMQTSTLEQAPVPQARLPLVFNQLPPAVAAANPQMANAIQALQQSFVDAIGGPNQNPADPAYYQRWTAAQAKIDAQYRLLVGNQAFLVEQMQVSNK